MPVRLEGRFKAFLACVCVKKAGALYLALYGFVI